MIEAYITNAGDGRGDWITFPATKDQVRDLFSRIGVDGVTFTKYVITNYHVGICGINGLTKNADIDELNYFASLLDDLSFDGIDSFEAAALHGLYSGNLKDLINLVQNPDCYEYARGVGDDEELGRYLIEVLERDKIPNWIESYFDYEAYGRDFAVNKGGIFVDTGFVYRNDTPFVEHYNGRNVPDEYRVLAAPGPPEKMPIMARLDMYDKQAGTAPDHQRPAPDRADRDDR